MVLSYIDEIVDYPAKIMRALAHDKQCVGLLLNKAFDDVGEADSDRVLEEFIYDYPYVDETTTQTAAYIMIDIEFPEFQNYTIKDVAIYITVACHKKYIKLDKTIFKGLGGNRKDNLVRFINKKIAFSNEFGIGRVLQSAIVSRPSVGDFIVKEMVFKVPEFNMQGVLYEV